MYDCIIIGGGIAGLTAGIYAARAGLSTVIVEKEQCGGQALMADIVENYPGFEGYGFELIEKIQQKAEKSGALIEYDEIKSVDFSGKIKYVKGFEKTYRGKTIIVATGARHKRAGFIGEDTFAGMGVSYCAICDGAFFKEKDVAVIGGANTAVSEALYLANICRKVYLIYRGSKLRADFALTERIKSRDNIEVIYNSIPIRVTGDTTVEKIITDKEEINVNGVFVAVGLIPVTGLFYNILELDDRGYIKTKHELKTNCKGVFAAGDCRVKKLQQMICSASDGAIAATEAVKAVKESEI